MTFSAKIKSIYEACGPTHILPFLGGAFEIGDPSVFRVAVVGLNAYVSDGDWPKNTADLRAWYPSWWQAAGHGKTHRFFRIAYREADILARRLSAESKLFVGLKHDGDPKGKSGFHGTNAVKVFLGEDHKKSFGLTPDILAPYTPTWHQELDAMAEHDVMPHLIVALGTQIWEVMWRSLHPAHGFASEHFWVQSYRTCGQDVPCYHHANLITVAVGSGTQSLLLVRLSHPASQNNRRAEWLLSQPPFRELAQIG